MAKSEEIKLEEIKRLLRRLDKTMPTAPPAPPSPSDFAPLRFESSNSDARPDPVAASRRGGPAQMQVATGASVRTVLLAAGVSAAVSGSIAFVLFDNSAPRPAMFTEAPVIPSGAARQPSPVAEATPIFPEAVPVPSVAKRVAEAARERDALQATEAAATPEPTETRPLETGSADRSEPPKDAAVQEAAPERAPADKTEGQTLAALDASQFLRRGLNMLESGNVSTAQLLLERAAELGNGQAAFALATTYDGAPGAPRGGSTVRPNVELAWRWYERAQELGIEGAQKRLDELKKGAASGG